MSTILSMPSSPLLFVFFISLFHHSITFEFKPLPPSQYQASCFPKCSCNATTVECKNLNEIKTEIFEHILPKIYPELDTVKITGNDLGDLPADNLFGNRNRHLRMTYLDISQNNIRSFASNTFFGAPKVEFLYLQNNELESVGSKPFDYMPALRIIDLTSAFGDRVSAKKKVEVIGDMLEAGHNFKHLEELILNSNELTSLDSEMFCKLHSLGRLVLADNLLESLELNAKCLPSLRFLVLRNNRFTSVPKMVYNGLDLNMIDVSQNPLQCDCKLEEFVKFANEDMSIFSNQGMTTCAAPTEYAGKKIFELDTEKVNLCERSSRLLHWLILFLIIGVCIYVYRHLRRAGRLPRMPAVFGYSQLKSNDEMSNQPAFV